MKTVNQLLILITMLLVGLGNQNATAQDNVPSEVKSIVGFKLEEGQVKLKELGYEVCASNFFGKTQDWFNEKNQVCITLKFHKKTEEILEVAINPETSECQRKLTEARKVWENYHDGQAPVNAEKIDQERSKLSNQGFTVSYWVQDVSPGRTAEYWVNETTKKAKLIVWETASKAWVMTNDTSYEYGHNPAPKNQ